MANRPRPRRTAAADRAAREKRDAIIKIAGVAGVVVVVASIYFKVAASHRELDPVTLCPAEPESITVLLIDVTDPMNLAQRQDFQNQLTRLKNSIPRYGQLIVTKVDVASDSLLTPVIVRCNPGTAADENEATGDPKRVQKLHDEEFDRPLDAAFAQISRATGAGESPILESVQSVALTELQKPAAAGKPRRLVVVSDLLQHTQQISFYSALPEPAPFIESSAFRRTRTDLRNIEVELWMLERSDAASTQPRALADLWDQVITAQGGDVRRVYNVSG